MADHQVAQLGPPPHPGGPPGRPLVGAGLGLPAGLLGVAAGPALAYLAAITAAEVAVSVVDPRWGLPLHALVLFALLLHGARAPSEPLRALLWSLALAPLIRILSLSLPLAGLPMLYWFAIISVPVFAATFAAAHALGYTRRELGLVLNPRSLPLDLAMPGVGLLLGIGEYLILQPQPLARDLTLAEAWLPALILAVSTGFEEELLFRGLLQRAATGSLGTLTGLLYVTVLFTVLHVGYLSLVDLVFVFAVGLFFALLVRRSGSLLGVTLGHAGVNVGLFVIWPHLLPRLIAGG